jgi:hypothetical protein
MQYLDRLQADLSRQLLFSSSGLAHPVEIPMPFLDRKVQVYARQFLAECPNVKIAFNLAEPGDFLL